MWCEAGAMCSPIALSSDELKSLGFLGDALLCQGTSAWSSMCSGIPSNPIGSDPMYGAQSWVFDLINVRPVWQEGFTGRGVQIVVNDDGVDLTLPDFGALPDGSAKFDISGSCIGPDACLGGGTPFQGAACTAGTDERGDAWGFHGTACSAIAIGNANGFCSVGVAPGATLAGVQQ